MAATILASFVSNGVAAADPPNGLVGIFGESGGAASVVPSTGAMTYSVPFQLPSARGNAQPSLVLSYASGAQSGEAGVGWSLSLPSIERAPLSGWPKYVDNGAPASEDRFSYNGQPLTFICVVNGTPDCPRNERVGELPGWANGYRHYRLQVEGSFERFFWDPPHDRWIVQERGGNILEFGLALTRPDLQLASAYETDTPSGRTFRWYLAAQRDLHGSNNLAFYRWKSEGPGKLKYLSDIYYTPPASTGAGAPVSAFAYHVELLWEDPPYRQQDFTNADKRPHYKRLRRVAISAKPWSGAPQREMVRAYNLAYFPERTEASIPGRAPLWGRSSLKSVQLEGRCTKTAKETNERLADPTNCPRMPAITFDYAPATLAVGVASFAQTGPPGSSVSLSYPSSSAILDINRDGFPDLLEAWPTNFRRKGHTVEWNDCRHGDFIVDAGANPQTFDPKLACDPDSNTESVFDIRSARRHKAWLNRGPGIGGLSLAYNCLDAGGSVSRLGFDSKMPTFYQVTTPQGFGSSPPALFTQYGAEAVGEWGNGSLLWSLAGYSAFGFASASAAAPGAVRGPNDYDEATFLTFCPEFKTNPAQPALRWTKTGSAFWAKDASADDRPERTYFSIVDIDGDGHGDLLADPATSGRDGVFERAAVRFSRRISGLETAEGARGPALHPFLTSDSQAITITSRFAEYSTYADINGDGILDLVTGNASLHNGVPEVRLGDGRGGFGCDPTHDVACVVPGNGSWLGRAFLLFTPPKIAPFPLPRDAFSPWPLVTDFIYSLGPAHFFHDVTGDGLADLIKFEPASSDIGPNSVGRIRLWVNTDGRTFRCANATNCVVATLGIPGQTHLSPLNVHRIVFTDIDGNGTEDFVLVDFNGIWTFSFLAVVPVPSSGPRSPRPGLLTRIGNGVGADTEIVYETIQELDRAARDPSADSFQRPWSTHVPKVLPVVTRIVTRDSASVAGTTPMQPFQVHRGRWLQYRDPAYDLWQGSFMGFRQVRSVTPSREVTQTWFYFGACESGPFVDPACPRGSDASNNGTGSPTYTDKALAGAVARVDRFVSGAGSDRPTQWLSTTTNTYDMELSWIAPPGSNPDRPVMFAKSSRVDEYLYDTTAPVSVVDEIHRPTAPQRVPRQPAMVHLRSDTLYDEAGNVKTSIRRGRVEEGTARGLDDVITTTYLPVAARCKSDWACLPLEVRVSDLPLAATQDRELRNARFTYNGNGDLVEVKGRLFSTSLAKAGLERDPVRGTGPPQTAQLTTGWKTLRTFDVDAFGNVTAARGAAGPNQVCSKFVFDSDFRQFAQVIDQFAGGGCSGTMLRAERAFDRGMEVATETRLLGNTRQTVELDPFGRVARSRSPAADGRFGTELSLQFTYHTKAPLPWVEVAQRVDQDRYLVSIEIYNGLGEPVLGFDQADRTLDGHPWILRGWTERNSGGLPIASFRPWFFDADPRIVADKASPLSPTGLRVSTFRDNFGRPLSTSDGAFTTGQFAYEPLVVKAKDAEQVKPAGPFGGNVSVMRRDGHLRTIEMSAPTDGDTATTQFKYLGTGEVTTVRRLSKRSPSSYERRMEWDSFGRLLVNAEPNTSGMDGSGVFRSWRYVYDAEGRIAGTSDARGCGKNISYDALGRLIAEDLSPCSADQPAHTAPNLSNGEGAEAFYRYDTYEAGQVEARTTAFEDREELALGRLVSIQDRGAHTRLNYDRRGRVRRVTRQIAKPGSGTSLTGTGYAKHWFRQELDMDIGDRLIRRTTGLEGPELASAGSFDTQRYSARGALSEIGSSYGTLVKDLTYSPSGNRLRATYGDLAATQVVRGYDSRERLQRLRAFRATAPGLWSAPSKRLYSQPSGDTTQLILTDLTFTHDDVGNPLAITEGATSPWPQGAKPVSRSFDYDAAYRLRQVDYVHNSDAQIPVYLAELKAGSRQPIPEQQGHGLRVARQTFRIDWQGNTTDVRDDDTLRFERSLGRVSNGKEKDGTPRGPNQLIDAEGIHAAYDAAGNLTELTVARPADPNAPSRSHRFRYDWDETGQMARARRWDYETGPVPAHDAATVPVWDLAYAYTEGRRVLTSVTGAEGVARHTLDVFETLRIDRTEYGSTSSSYRVESENQIGFIGGVARVSFDRGSRLPAAGGSPIHVFFNIADHLGSSAFTIDKDSSEVVERVSYLPYGAIESDYRPGRWGSAREHFQFTGKEQDLEVGAIYFGARYYQAQLGRFMSADPLTIHELASDLNPYAYVGGRVTTHVDPIGLCGGGYAIASGSVTYEFDCNSSSSADAKSSQAEAMAAQAAVRKQAAQVVTLGNLLIGTAHIPIPGTKKYFTPNGIRKSAANALIDVLDPFHYGAIIKSFTGNNPFTLHIGEDKDDASLIVGTVAVTAATVIAGRVGVPPAAAATGEEGALIHLAEKVNREGGFWNRLFQTVSVLKTAEGPLLVGAQRDLTPAQRALVLSLDHIPVKLAGVHAEGTVLQGALNLRLTPLFMGVSKTICWVCVRDIPEYPFANGAGRITPSGRGVIFPGE